MYLTLIGIITRWDFLIWELILIYCGLFFLCCFFIHYVSAKFHLWPSSDDLPRPRIGMLSLVTLSPVITAFHSCCLSHHVFDQVNLWPAWAGIETAIFWHCSPGTVETQRLYPLRHGPRRAINDGFFLSYKSLSGLPESGPYRIFVLDFNWNHFEMRLLNLRINFYLLQTLCPHLSCFFFVFCFLSEVAVNHLKKARDEIWPKRSEWRINTKKRKKKKKLLRWGQKVRNK